MVVKTVPTTVIITKDQLTTITKPYVTEQTSYSTGVSTQTIPYGAVKYTWSTYTTVTSKRVASKYTTYKTSTVPVTATSTVKVTAYSTITSTTGVLST